MDDLFFGAASALWLGILTSISPCPLATNIAAISYIGRRVGKPQQVLSAGLLYTVGRSLTYLVLGVLLVSSLLEAPYLSHLLQKYMNKLLGPILLVAGMFMLELLKFGGSGSGISEKMQARVDRGGTWGAGLLGFVFALTFCPISAALFFGSLIPLAVSYQSEVYLPTLYGIGTALPVFIFALFIALGARSVGKAFDRITQIERWARWVTGLVFIGVGIYYTLRFIFGVIS